jgi:hypothetical protein
MLCYKRCTAPYAYSSAEWCSWQKPPTLSPLTCATWVIGGSTLCCRLASWRCYQRRAPACCFAGQPSACAGWESGSSSGGSLQRRHATSSIRKYSIGSNRAQSCCISIVHVLQYEQCAGVAQWQSSCFVNSRSSVRPRPPAPVLPYRVNSPLRSTSSRGFFVSILRTRCVS